MGGGQARGLAAGDAGTRLTALIDTNVLVRHLTGDPPQAARRATRYLERAGELILTDIVAAECLYVLESYYELDRARVVEAMRSIVAFPAIRAENETAILRALELHESEGIHFAEAYLVARAEAGGTAEIVSFDRALDRIESVGRIEP